MKKLLVALCCLSAVACKAQFGNQPVYQNQPWIFNKWISIGPYTTAQMPAASACRRCLLYNSDSSNYAFSNGTAWIYWGGVGSSLVAHWGSITGTISSQTDLMNLLNAKVNYSDTSAMLAPYARAALFMRYSDTSGMLSPYLRIGVGVKYSDTAAMLAPYLRAYLFTPAGIGLGQLLNRPQVVNMGGWDSVAVYAHQAGFPSAASGPTIAYAQDSNALYFNNRSAYTKIAGGSGTGGVSADSSVFLTRYRASVVYVPWSAYTATGIDSLLGYTPYNASNPNGYISANQVITLQNNTGSDVTFSTTGSILLKPTVTINSNAVTYGKLQTNPGKTLIGNYQSSTGNNGAVFIGPGILWDSDTLKADTSLLATLTAVTRRGYLTAETDPIALAKTLTMTGTASRGIVVTNSGSAQALSTNPTWTFTADTAFLATVTSLQRQGFLTAETDPVARAKTVTVSPGRGVLVTGAAQTVGNNPAFTVAADTGVMASQYWALHQGFLTAEADPVALAKVITLNQGYGVTVTGTAGQALSVPPVWGIKVDTTLIVSKIYGAATYLPKNGTYHLYFQSQGGGGDTNYISGHDSIITIAGIIDSANFHHYIQGGRLVMYTTNSGGTLSADTASIFQSIAATGDTLRVSTTSVPNFLGQKIIIPPYSATGSGLVSAAKGRRIDSTVYVKWGKFHHLVRAPWTKDSLEIKGIAFQDSTGKVKITIVGDTTDGILFNIDASGLAGSGTMDSVSLNYTNNAIFNATLTGNHSINPTLNLSANTACSYCFLFNNSGSTALPTYQTLSLTGPAFNGQGTTVQVYHGGGVGGNPFFGPVNMPTDVTGVMNAAQFPALGGVLSNAAGSLNISFVNGAIPAAAMGTGSVNLASSAITGILPAANGGTGVNNGSATETRAGNVTFAGAFPVTITSSATTNVTLPPGTNTLLANNGIGSSLNGITWDVQGTANEVLVNNDVTAPHTGHLVLSGPQPLGTANTPTHTNVIMSAMTTTGIPKYTTGVGFSIAQRSDFPLMGAQWVQQFTAQANTTAETSILAAGVTGYNNLNIPTAVMQTPGSAYRYRLSGVWQGFNSGTLTVRVYLGSNLVSTTVTSVLPNTSSTHWNVDGVLTFIAYNSGTGNASIANEGTLTYPGSSSQLIVNDLNNYFGGAITIPTASPLAFNVTFQFSASNQTAISETGLLTQIN